MIHSNYMYFHIPKAGNWLQPNVPIHDERNWKRTQKVVMNWKECNYHSPLYFHESINVACASLLTPSIVLFICYWSDSLVQCVFLSSALEYERIKEWYFYKAQSDNVRAINLCFCPNDNNLTTKGVMLWWISHNILSSWLSLGEFMTGATFDLRMFHQSFSPRTGGILFSWQKGFPPR
jgi:hypothetical protein